MRKSELTAKLIVVLKIDCPDAGTRILEEQFFRALMEVDEAVVEIKKNAKADLVTFEKDLKKVMAKYPIPYLDQKEAKELKEYMAVKKPEVEPIIAAFSHQKEGLLNYSLGDDVCYTFCLLFFQLHFC